MRKIIKSIFVGLNLDEKTYNELGNVGVNHLIVAVHSLNDEKWKMLKGLKCLIGISIDCFGKDGCPANPVAFRKLRNKITKALKWKPDEIWLDHFRFDGHWEAIKGTKIPEIHRQCKWCGNKNRVDVITSLAEKVMERVKKRSHVGYFAVPLTQDEFPEIVSGLAQEHSAIGRIFDLSSPILYHRMIKKPVTYISWYVKYLNALTKKPVLPIIQIKDMPDDLSDKLSWNEVKGAFNEAKKDPSIGVSFFMWEHAAEKNKAGLIKELFSSL